MIVFRSYNLSLIIWKKFMKKAIIYAILLSGCIIFLQKDFFAGKNQKIARIDQEVKKINVQMLKKYYRKDIQKDSDGNDYAVKTTSVYGNKKNQLRKVILVSQSEERDWRSIFYYNLRGRIILEIFHTWDMGGSDSRGRVYYSNKKMLKKRLNKKRNWSLKEQFEKLGPIQLSKLKFLGNFTFKTPKKNNRVYVNHNNVVLRSGSSVRTKKLSLLYALQGSLKILAVGKKETIKGFGTHHWYQVDYSGYQTLDQNIKGRSGWVFGAFLEPVEHEVN